MGARATTVATLLVAGLFACRGDRSGAPDQSIPLIGDIDLDKLFTIHGPQVVADEDVTVAARAWRGPGFTLPSPRSVRVVADGKEHTDKGFKLYVMSSDDLAKFEKRKPFKDVPGFEGSKVRSFDRTQTLPAGTWCVVVYNSENARKAMVVHLRVVAD